MPTVTAAATRTVDDSNVCSRGSAGTVSSRLAIAPEAVAADSEITAEHPEWLLASAPGPEGLRLLDLAIRPAMVHVWERLTKLLDRHQPGYLVWLCDSTSTPARGYQGEPTVHARTLATYRLLDALRERYPQVQIQAVSADLALATRVQSMTAAARKTSLLKVRWLTCCRSS
jgi:alpha-galactosidase